MGVAIAVAVLAGALLVGDSVRASLRDLFLQRLGNTSHVISASGFFREELANDIRNDNRFVPAGFAASCPLIVMNGAVTHDATGRLSSAVQVYGVDERFWTFQGKGDQSAGEQDVFISPSLAKELGAVQGDSLLLRVLKPSSIPIESLHGRRDDAGRTLRLTLRNVLPVSALGEFSLLPQQTSVRTIFVSLKLLQQNLDQPGKVNTILISSEDSLSKTEVLDSILKDKMSLADMGVNVRAIDDQHSLSLEENSAIINDSLAETARLTAVELNLRTVPVLSYLANGIRANGRDTPYSIVTAIDQQTFKGLQAEGSLPPIVLNEWAARDLDAKPGDEVTLAYYLWQQDGSLLTREAKFQLTEIVPITLAAADRNLVPEYPGITGSENISDWDPPFPVDLQRIRKQDEEYWHQYRTTPKAFISISMGQEIWGTRFGKLTSMRVVPADASQLQSSLATFRDVLKSKLSPASMGFFIYPARAQGLEASQGATDFGEYFLYFSFFLVCSALLLASLFFKLGIEQRLREIGTLQAIGFPASKIRGLFLREGLVLAVIGGVMGLVLAIAYGKLMMYGLGTWWVGATGTSDLSLHISVFSLAIGGVGGLSASFLTILWTLRRVARASARSLLHGDSGSLETSNRLPATKKLRIAFSAAIFFFGMGLVLIALTLLNVINDVLGFFGGGVSLLIALLCYEWASLNKIRRNVIAGSGFLPVLRMGFRNATNRPARTVLCIALIASASFIVVSVDAFRRHDEAPSSDRKTGSGGYALIGESDIPMVYDPNTLAGREALNLSSGEIIGALATVEFTRFRLRPGDDASCLNLYQPRNPRVLGATDRFIQSNRFAFQDSLANSNEEKANPWSLLNRDFGKDVVPVVVDANSMTYVLHLKLGQDFVLQQSTDGKPVRLRIVAALNDSLFQSELVMSERNFLTLFPEIEGYRLFLIDAPASQESTITAMLEKRLSDYGVDVVSTQERLAEFHRVENTYLSTFQLLGGLGLVLGTLGLAAILMRNVLERRKELALLRAIGFNKHHFAWMVIAENAFMLASGLIIGTACALLAIAPVFVERGGRVPILSLGLLLLAVIGSGLIASLAATAAAIRAPLLPALRAE